MALSTQKYREEAIALCEQGYGPRAVERLLTEKYGVRVVAYPTIRLWHQAHLQERNNSPECCIQHA